MATGAKGIYLSPEKLQARTIPISPEEIAAQKVPGGSYIVTTGQAVFEKEVKERLLTTGTYHTLGTFNEVPVRIQYLGALQNLPVTGEKITGRLEYRFSNGTLEAIIHPISPNSKINNYWSAYGILFVTGLLFICVAWGLFAIFLYGSKKADVVEIEDMPPGDDSHYAAKSRAV